MPNRLRLDVKAAYQINIQGQHWCEYLGGLSISTENDPEYRATTLTGEVLDQAALLGILNSLYDMDFPLLAVEFQSIPIKEKDYAR